MKLYFSPGACSLASRISLHEAGIDAEFEQVNLKTKITEHGYDYGAINPKGYVPMLVLDDGEAVTENVAILTLLADRDPALQARGPLGRIHMIEMLSYLSSELHIAFKPFWHAPDDPAQRESARKAVEVRLAYLADQVREMYLFGPQFTVADAYLFVMLRWAFEFGVQVPLNLIGFFERVAERPAVRRALAEEGLELTAVPVNLAPETDAEIEAEIVKVLTT